MLINCIVLYELTCVCIAEIMSFSSPIPERANSRLAMIGILACLASEWNTGTKLDLYQQDSSPPLFPFPGMKLFTCLSNHFLTLFLPPPLTPG